MKAVLSVILVAGLLVSGIMLAGPADSGKVGLKTSALTSHAPIRINSNADFQTVDGVANNVTGNGTAWNPWIIENLDIDGAGNTTCIYIGNTTECFIIRNCSLNGANVSTSACGIELNNADNGTIFNNTMTGNNKGIHMSVSTYNAISNNSILSNANCGIDFATSCHHNNIGNNTISNNGVGILLWGSDSNDLFYNTIDSNEYGIEIDSNFITMANNTMLNNSIIMGYPSLSYWVTHTIDDSNTVNSKPVYYLKNQVGGTVPLDAGEAILANCTDVIVQNLDIGNTTVGIDVGFSSNITILHNTISSAWRGIYLQSSDNNSVTDNQIVECGDGVSVYNSVDNIVQENALFNSAICINSDNNTVADNIFSNLNAVFTGIFLNSDNNTVVSNAVSGGTTGIYIAGQSNNSVMHNIVTNCSTGIYLQQATYNDIVNNTIADNQLGFDINMASDYNKIFHNNITANTVGAHDPCANTWDDGYPDGGNYWSDYSGSDIYGGASQDILGRDGIGDTPYPVPLGSNTDRYPLMHPYDEFANDEFVPPLALDHSPNGTAVPVDALIVLTWNETMDWASIEAAFSYTDGVHNYTSANGTWSHSIAANVSTFTPTHPFMYETSYNVTINCSASDIAGNHLDQNKNGTGGEWADDVLAWDFTTADEAPFILWLQPADGQIDADPFKPIRVMFSEPMDTVSVEKSFSYTDGNHTWNVTGGSPDWNDLDTEFTFSPVTALAVNTTFNAILNGTLATDKNDNALAGGDHLWWFRTWLEPPAPRVTSTYPTDDAVDVKVNTNINIGLDSEMNPQTVEDAFSYTDGYTTWNVANGTVAWSSDYSFFSFQPTQALDFHSYYTVTVSSAATSLYGITLDGNENGIAEPDDNFTFGFTTVVEPPRVVSYYPASMQTGVPVDLATIQINFSKTMNIATVTNALTITPSTQYTTSFTGGFKNLTIQLNTTLPLQEGVGYTVSVGGTAMDLYGTKLDGNGDGWPGDVFSFIFYTKDREDLKPPTVLGFIPSNNATIPVENFYLTVGFSSAMNKTLVEYAFSFRNATASLNGTFAWSSTGKSMKFTPTDPLDFNTTYFVSIAGTAKDMRGLAIGNTTSWQYVTEDAPKADNEMFQWVIYGLLFFFLALSGVLYMANRSLRRDLKRTRVKLKKLQKQTGVKETPPAEIDADVPEDLKEPETPAPEVPDEVVGEEE